MLNAEGVNLITNSLPWYRFERRTVDSPDGSGAIFAVVLRPPVFSSQNRKVGIWRTELPVYMVILTSFFVLTARRLDFSISETWGIKIASMSSCNFILGESGTEKLFVVAWLLAFTSQIVEYKM